MWNKTEQVLQNKRRNRILKSELLGTEKYQCWQMQKVELGRKAVYGYKTWSKLDKPNPTTKQIVGMYPAFKFNLFNKANNWNSNKILSVNFKLVLFHCCCYCYRKGFSCVVFFYKKLHYVNFFLFFWTCDN